LVGRRRDLVQDRTRAITRLRSLLVEIFPGLERSLDLRRTGPLQLLCRYQTPAQLRRAGQARLRRYLEDRHVVKAEELARGALTAAQGQSLSLPGEETAARLIADMATRLIDLNQQIAAVDRELEQCFFSHPQARIITSLPGMGPCLGAEFLVAVGGSLASFSGADALAAYAGLAPVSADSGLTQGRRRRAKGGNKQLKRVFYQSAFASLRHPASRRFYDRKRAEGKRHHQAVLALARRRVNVLWAMLRDERCFEDLPLAA
jgi:transposase